MKERHIEEVKSVIKKGNHKFWMKIFINEATLRFYKQIQWDNDIEVVVSSEQGADSLIEYLTI